MKRQRKLVSPRRLLILLLLTIGVGATLQRLIWPSSAPVQLLPGATAQALSPDDRTAEAGTHPSGARSQTKQQPFAAPTEVLLPVYIVGAVRFPGIYFLPPDKILDDVIAAAGGAVADAALSEINLALPVVAHQHIRIPTKAEVAADPASQDVVQPPPDLPTTPLDLNRATAEQLDALPGIGPATAQAILRYREQHGPFQRIEQLMEIPGIKQSRFDAIRDFVTAKP